MLRALRPFGATAKFVVALVALLMGPMWRGLRSWIERDIVERDLASPGDTDVAIWVDTVDEAVEVVRANLGDFLRRHKVVRANLGDFLRRHKVILPPVDDSEPEAALVAGTRTEGAE